MMRAWHRWASLGTGALGLACLVLLPWVASGDAYLHWGELASSPVRYERVLAWASAVGTCAAAVPALARGRAFAWAVAGAGSSLAAASLARPIGFALARAWDGEAKLASVGPGALVPFAVALALSIAVLAAAPGRRIRLGLTLAAATLVCTGILPLGTADGLHVDEWTAALAAAGGAPVGRPFQMHVATTWALAGALAALGLGLSARITNAIPTPLTRGCAAFVAGAAAILAFLADHAWTRLPGATMPWPVATVGALLLFMSQALPVPSTLARRRARPLSPRDQGDHQ